MRLDFPEPVGPVRTKRSTPSKSQTVSSRYTVKPSSSSLIGRMDLVEKLVEERSNAGVGSAPLLQILAEEIARRTPQISFRLQLLRFAGAAGDDDVNGVREDLPDLVGEPGSGSGGNLDPQVSVSELGGEPLELAERRLHAAKSSPPTPPDH